MASWINRHSAFSDMDLGAVTVAFDFLNPVIPGGNTFLQDGIAWIDKPWHGRPTATRQAPRASGNRFIALRVYGESKGTHNRGASRRVSARNLAFGVEH